MPVADAAAGREFGEHARVVGRIDHHGDVARGSWPRRAASRGRRRRCSRSRRRSVHSGLRDRGREGIEVDDQQVDGRDALRAHHGVVRAARGPAAPPWIFGCSVLTRPSMISGKPVRSATSRTGEPGVAQRACGAAGRKQFDAARGQRAREFDEAGLVGNREQRAAGARDIAIGSVSRAPNSRSFLRSVPRLMPRIDGRPALVAVRVVEHGPEQRLFDLAQHQVVEARRSMAVEAGEVVGEGALGVVAQRRLRGSAVHGTGPVLCRSLPIWSRLNPDRNSPRERVLLHAAIRRQQPGRQCPTSG